MTLERRTLVEPVEFREEDGRLVAHGYAYVFNKRSQDLGGFVEQIAPGAGRKTIKEQDIRALFNHEPSMILGRKAAGTLRIREDQRGGAYEIDLPDTTVGRDVAELLRRGDISGSSFGFRQVRESFDLDGDLVVRTVKEFSLRDVGPVTFPAYTDSTSALRSLAEHRSLDFDLVTAAARAGELGTLLSSDPEETRQDNPETTAGPATVVRPRMSWLYA